MVQISGLRNQLDQFRPYTGMEDDSTHLRVKLQAFRDMVEKLEDKVNIWCPVV